MEDINLKSLICECFITALLHRGGRERCKTAQICRTLTSDKAAVFNVKGGLEQSWTNMSADKGKASVEPSATQTENFYGTF